MFRSTPLYEIIAAVIRKLSVGDKAACAPAFRRFAAGLTRDFPEHESMDWKILKVLWAFFRSAYQSSHKPADDPAARLAVRWLIGDRLERDELRRIDLDLPASDDDSDEMQDEHVLRVLVVLTEFAREGSKPFMLCLDQVDVLNDDRIRALATFLHILLDSSRDLTTIFCGVQEMLLDHVNRQVIAGADWDRIRQCEPVQLARLDAEGTRQILQRRLENFIEPLMQLPEIKECVHNDGLFPLGSRWLAAHGGSCRPPAAAGHTMGDINAGWNRNNYLANWGPNGGCNNGKPGKACFRQCSLRRRLSPNRSI